MDIGKTTPTQSDLISSRQVFCGTGKPSHVKITLNERLYIRRMMQNSPGQQDKLASGRTATDLYALSSIYGVLRNCGLLSCR